MAPPAGQGVSLHAAFAGVRRVPPPVNEPINSYAPGSPQRAELKARLASMAGEKIDIPLIIGGKEIRTGATHPVTMPHDHGHLLAEYHTATSEHVQQAIAASAAARREWAAWPWKKRASGSDANPSSAGPAPAIAACMTSSSACVLKLNSGQTPPG